MFKFLSCLLFIFSFTLDAYHSPGKPTGFVNDFAAILTEQQREALATKLAQLERETGVEFAVVLIENLGGDTIEKFAVKLFEEWGIGKKGHDNGLLLLIALADRKMRFEVGYGLEGVVPDAIAYRIINEKLKPAFKQHDFYGGIAEAFQEVELLLKSEAETPSSAASALSWLMKNWAILLVVFLIVVNLLFFIILAIVKRTSKVWYERLRCYRYYFFLFNVKRGTKDGSGSGNGFGGFGGGKSGGGGSSGGW